MKVGIISFLFLLLPFGQALAESSSMQISARLYYDNRVASDEPGTVREFTSWRNCLYVSFAELDGDFYLDVWNIDNQKSPRFIEEHAKGNIHSDSDAVVPDAHLQAPRDMRVIDSHLVYWRDLKAEIYKLNADCSLQSQDLGFVFPDAIGEGMGRLSYGGQMAATRMYDANGSSTYALINLQDPTKPFLQSVAGLEGEISGSYNGQPSILSIDKDNRSLDFRTFEQSRSAHVSGFWSETILGEIFKLENSALSLRGLARKVLNDNFVRSQQQRAIEIFKAQASSPAALAAAKASKRGKKSKKRERRLKRLRKQLTRWQRKLERLGERAPERKRKKFERKVSRIEGQISRIGGGENGSEQPDSGDDSSPEAPSFEAKALELLISERFGSAVELQAALSGFSIQPQDSVKLAVSKIVEAQISAELELTLRQNLSVDLLGLLEDEIFSLPNSSIADLRSRLSGLLNEELARDGVVSYILDKLFSPLLNNPAFMQASLGDLLAQLTDNQAASAIDIALSTAENALPAQNILDALGFDLPACLQVPASARELLEIILVDAGPRLNRQGPAFWEIMKAVQFYFGNTDFAAYEAELNAKLQAFHGKLASELLSQSLGFIDQVSDLTKTPNAVFQEFGADFSVNALVSELISAAVIAELEIRFGANVSGLTVRAFFESQGLVLDPVRSSINGPAATIGDFLEWLRAQGLAELSNLQMLNAASAAELALARAKLELPLERALSELFGGISLDQNLSSALEHFILGRLDPSVFGSFVEESLGSVLAKMNVSESLTGVLGTAGLALQGDCISQWIVAIDAASAVAAGSIVFSPKAALLQASSLAVSSAYNFALKYSLQFVFQQLVAELFGGFSGEYRSWYTQLAQTSQQIDLAALGVPSKRIYNSAVSQDKIAVLTRDVGSIGALAGEDRAVTLSVFNPKRLADGARHIALGDWERVTGVKAAGDYILVSGSKLHADGSSDIGAMLVNFKAETPELATYFGSNSPLFSAAPQFEQVRGGQSFAVNSAASGIVLFE